MLAEPFLVLALTYMVLLFPRSRLDRMGKVVVGLFVGVIAVYVPWLLLADTLAGTRRSVDARARAPTTH